MLVPKSLDPRARGRRMPLPDPRPADEIAKLFPPVDLDKDQPKEQSNGLKPPEPSTAPATAAEGAKPAVPVQPAAAGPQMSASQAAPSNAVPLPQARPDIAPGREARRQNYHRHYRSGR
jgi:membrane-bound lytic murein transglycosylase A